MNHFVSVKQKLAKLNVISPYWHKWELKLRDLTCSIFKEYKPQENIYYITFIVQ